jgi:hypothetical protein
LKVAWLQPLHVYRNAISWLLSTYLLSQIPTCTAYAEDGGAAGPRGRALHVELY